LDVHNSLRSKLALGQLTGGLNGAIFPPAARMATVSWNQELADFALINAKQCVEQGDFCHNTADFKFSGQNIGQMTSLSDADSMLNYLLNSWFNEYKSANATNIQKLGTSFVA
jgi:hypothetical protein